MPNKMGFVLKDVLSEVKPSKKEMDDINETLANYIKKIKRNIQNRKINAQVFVGGSAAKATLIKKDSYDIDIFIRFDKKYKDEILSDLTEKILKGTGARITRIHGSRDYFKIQAMENLFFEVVPVKRIQSPREAENVTDFSYSHVNYIKKKIKSEKLLDEIRLAKAFCYANGSYGAESYVQGFSGYGLELLIYHYKTFIKFVKAIAKMKIDDDKVVIDIEKHHKNKSRILMDLNEAKLKSPIILVDPTYRQRNVLAALSEETLRNFQAVCRNFLKNPRKEFFEKKVINIEKLKEDANNNGYEFVLLKIITDKQEGDIAGSKMLKFYRHLSSETERFFEIKNRGFEYKGNKEARAFFVGGKKEWILVTGPEVNDKKNVDKFRKRHKKVLIKNNRLYSKYIVTLSLKHFLHSWKEKYKDKIRGMSIKKFDISS
ncbi:MAG: nucleotidyltransferase domain-containing protein [Nanoarchaeota archaeon]|nr:nucleotidyltransferase domain-containing protein [Nanoarchaeota archaeon]